MIYFKGDFKSQRKYLNKYDNIRFSILYFLRTKATFIRRAWDGGESEAFF